MRSPRGARAAGSRGGFRRPSCAAGGSDYDLDRHAEMVGGKAGPGAGDRHSLARVPGDRHADQIVIADDAVGWIEFDPAGPRQINLDPGMGGAAADLLAAPVFGTIEIAG